MKFPRTTYYRLVNGQPVPCPELDFLRKFPELGNMVEYAEQVRRDHDLIREIWSEEHRRIASTKLRGIHVSTVFLVIDHSFGSGPPVLFETMVFGGFFDELQRRYCTIEDARRGHDEVVQHIAQFRYVPTWLQNAMRVTDDFFRNLPSRMRRYKRDSCDLWKKAVLYVNATSRDSRSACARLWNRIRGRT